MDADKMKNLSPEMLEILKESSISYEPKTQNYQSRQSNKSNKATAKNLSIKIRSLSNVLKNTYGVEVGWFPGMNYPDGVSIAGVAKIQEYGDAELNIPSRPFMRPTIRDNRRKYTAMVKRGIANALEKNKNIEAVFMKIGAAIAADLKHAIMEVWEPPLSQKTIAHRKKTWYKAKHNNGYGNILEKPLIDTGRMINSIDYKSYKR